MNFQAIEAFLDIVRDTKKYDAMVASLKEQHKSIIEAIELTAPAKDIPRLHEDAVKTLEQAKADSKAMLSKANAEAEGIVATAKDILSKAKVEHDLATATTAETKAANKDAKQALADIKEKQRIIELTEQAIAKQQEQLLASQTEVSEKLAKLQEVMK